MQFVSRLCRPVGFLAAGAVALSVVVVGAGSAANAAQLPTLQHRTDWVPQTAETDGETLTIPAGYCTANWTLVGGQGGAKAGGEPAVRAGQLDVSLPVMAGDAFSLIPGAAGGDADSNGAGGAGPLLAVGSAAGAPGSGGGGAGSWVYDHVGQRGSAIVAGGAGGGPDGGKGGWSGSVEPNTLVQWPDAVVTFTGTSSHTGDGFIGVELLPCTVAESNQLYVGLVYRDLLNRQPDDAGLAHWSGALQQGAPYEQVANAITASAEFRSGLINAAYGRYLNRTADAAGLRSWLTAMNGGLHIEQMEAGFIASEEFYWHARSDDRNWVFELYLTVLERPASAAELDHWEGLLRAGVQRQDVAIGFLYSTEHLTTVVDGYYQRLLNRDIDPEGAHSWVTAIQRGVRDEQIIAGLVASSEYRSRL